MPKLRSRSGGPRLPGIVESQTKVVRGLDRSNYCWACVTSWASGKGVRIPFCASVGFGRRALTNSCFHCRLHRTPHCEDIPPSMMGLAQALGVAMLKRGDDLEDAQMAWRLQAKVFDARPECFANADYIAAASFNTGMRVSLPEPNPISTETEREAEPVADTNTVSDTIDPALSSAPPTTIEPQHPSAINAASDTIDPTLSSYPPTIIDPALSSAPPTTTEPQHFSATTTRPEATEPEAESLSAAEIRALRALLNRWSGLAGTLGLTVTS